MTPTHNTQITRLAQARRRVDHSLDYCNPDERDKALEREANTATMRDIMLFVALMVTALVVLVFTILAIVAVLSKT